ncbi:MAG: geranylgeranylglycerol-phosphate geranylgeranyltransferase [Ferruginibacter sp.]
MKTIAAFFRLIRWPNLFFIALTQSLFYFCVYQSLLTDKSGTHFLFCLLCMASILIAAAGYIINDYFDMHIDAINKPAKVVVDKLVKRRWAIIWHLVFSLAGLLISVYISYKTHTWIIAIANLGCVVLLWFYSTTFKKKLLSGNIIIAALTAWVIVVVYFFAGAGLPDMAGWLDGKYNFDVKKFYKLTILYASFAFIVSLIREVIKDLEDMDGDAKYNCKTMPVIWGVPPSKVFIAVWLVVCIASLTVLQLYAWQLGWWIVVLYSLVLIIIPLLYILKKLYPATSSADYHKLSLAIKAVMFFGILSMIFFRLI